MKVVFSCNEDHKDTNMSERFGRADYFAVVDVESGDMVFHEASNKSANHGAGIATAQWVIDQGAKAVVTNKVGPKAFDVLVAGKVGMYHAVGMSLNDAIDAYKKEALKPIVAASGK